MNLIDYSIYQVDYEFYPNLYSSRVINKGSYSLIASVNNKVSNNIGIVQVNEDLTIAFRVTYSISLQQHSCGFSQFNEDYLYILSYINDNNESIIDLYNHNDDSLENKVSIGNTFGDVEFKGFQCHFINENNVIICISFSQSDKYYISIYDNNFTLKNSNQFDLFTNCTFCNDDNDYKVDVY